MIYFNLKNFIYINLSNPFKTMKKLKGVFKPIKCKFSFNWGDWAPVLWCSYPATIQINTYDVLWKDKYDTPRYEESPYIWIHIWKLNFVWKWEAPEEYWEQALWYLYYSGTITQELNRVPDIEIARRHWPWTYYESKESTWNDEYLI